MPIVKEALEADEPGAEDQPEEEARSTRAKRRSKEQLIEDAEIPNDDAEVAVVFEETGQTEKRLWPEAVALRRQGQVKLSRKEEYAYLKLERDEQASRDVADREFEKPRIPQLEEEFDIVVAGVSDRWSWRDIVKHVVFNRNTNLTGPPEVEAALAWIQSDEGKEDAPPAPGVGEASDEDLAKLPPPPPSERQPEPVEASARPAAREEVIMGASGRPLIKVTMGYTEKIGLPEYSSLQIGPASVSRFIEDTGELMEIQRGDGSKITVNKSVYDAMQACAQDCEAVMRAERQAMIAFLESTRPGSTQQ